MINDYEFPMPTNIFIGPMMMNKQPCVRLSPVSRKLHCELKSKTKLDRNPFDRKSFDLIKLTLENNIKKKRVVNSDVNLLVEAATIRILRQKPSIEFDKDEKCTLTRLRKSVEKEGFCRPLHACKTLTAIEEEACPRNSHVNLKAMQSKYFNSFTDNEMLKNRRKLMEVKTDFQGKRLPVLPKISSREKSAQPPASPEKRVKVALPLLSSFDKQLKNIKAEHFYVMQHNSLQPVLAHRSRTRIEVASLTKIMTFYVVIKLSQQFDINIKYEQFTIDREVTKISGTTALLESGQIYTIEELLYGLMLSSGNDAALALAKWGGKYISNRTESLNPDSEKKPRGHFIQLFINRMNEETTSLGLHETTYGNSHGLYHINSRTTCEDTAKLCSVCLNLPVFRKVVSTRIHQYKVRWQDRKTRPLTCHWENTNKLLRRPGFIGIKTGITVTAGPCLASAYEFRDKIYIVIIAKSTKKSRRFKDTRKLLVHCISHLFSKQLSVIEKQTLADLNKPNQDLDSDCSSDQQSFKYGSISASEYKKRARIITDH